MKTYIKTKTINPQRVKVHFFSILFLSLSWLGNKNKVKTDGLYFHLNKDLALLFYTGKKSYGLLKRWSFRLAGLGLPLDVELYYI